MNGNSKLASAVLIGITFGVVGASAIHARQTKPGPGYVIAEVDISDLPTFQKYGAKVPETLAPFNHHYVARDGKPQSLEGDPAKSIVIIAFDSAEKAREWYDSPAYQAIKPIRLGASKTRMYVVEGLAPQ